MLSIDSHNRTCIFSTVNRNILNQLISTSSDKIKRKNLAKHMLKTKKETTKNNFKLKQQHPQAKHKHRAIAETQTHL